MKTNKIHTISFKTVLTTIILFTFGIGFIVLPRIFSRRMDNWIITTGTIIDFETTSKSKQPIVEYYVESEGMITGKGDVYISTYKKGDKVNIKYNPAFPNEFTMDVTYKMTTVPFVVTGSIIMALASAKLISEVVKGTSAKKQLLQNNSQLNLDYTPSFMFEYAPLRAETVESYTFKRQVSDLNNYEVTDSNGKVVFYTKRIKKGFTSSATYQLIDSTTKQTTIVNLKKSSFNNSKDELRMKVNGLSLAKYFETRHATFSISKEGNSIKYTLFNNGSTLGYIYEENNLIKNYEIETAKENIDDLSLFALCLTFK